MIHRYQRTRGRRGNPSPTPLRCLLASAEKLPLQGHSVMIRPPRQVSQRNNEDDAERMLTENIHLNSIAHDEICHSLTFVARYRHRFVPLKSRRLRLFRVTFTTTTTTTCALSLRSFFFRRATSDRAVVEKAQRSPSWPIAGHAFGGGQE